MKVTESFAIEATEEVRKDQRFEWYVNWLKSLENRKEQDFPDIFGRYSFVGVDNSGGNEVYCLDRVDFDEILTLDEVYSRYEKEIYKANGANLMEGKKTITTDYSNTPIKQPFQGSREYDFKLVEDFEKWWGDQRHDLGYKMFREYINQKHNTDILKQIAEHKAKIEELEKQLR